MAQEEFDAAVTWVGTPENKMEGVPTARKLILYANYKQALEGDVKGSQPWAVQFEARSKWDAWNKVKGRSKEDAMEAYVDELEEQKRNWGVRVDYAPGPALGGGVLDAAAAASAPAASAPAAAEPAAAE